MKENRSRETSAQGAAAFRDQLLALGWPNSADTGLVNGHAANPAQWPKERRDVGKQPGA